MSVQSASKERRGSSSVRIACFPGLAAITLFCMPLFGQESDSSLQSPHGDISESCAACHTQESWTELREPLEFDHTATGFELLRGHEAVSCQGCHGSLVFSAVPTACADCHEDPHAGDLGAGCESCHTSDAWDNRRLVYDYHSTTLFPLTGAHAATDCASCHRLEPPFEFSATPSECVLCHASEYESTSQPNHIRVGFSTDCQECHTTNAWEDSRFAGGPDFDHSIFFALVGPHRTAGCSDCHLGETFAGTPRDCFSCHREDYEETVAPPHAPSGFATTCESCHSASTWSGATFDHSATFALVGAHEVLECTSCHVDGLYIGTPRDCFSCHQADYQATVNPNHVSAGFATDCQSCHGESTWEGATFDHSTVFELLGAHAAADCESCHIGGQYTGTPRDCYSCHTEEYESTTAPNHRQAGFPTTCQDCHDLDDWSGASFDHDQFFELTGAHETASCLACHADGYAGTPSDCFSCHATEYNATEDPNHSAAGFPTECQTCHSTSDWSTAAFEHDSWALTGAHTSVSCESCHADGYAGTPTECYSCHATDYESTTEPDHQEAGFSISCEECHDTSSWLGGNLDHDEFFELVGGHSGLECSACHADGFEGTPTDCYSCHVDDYDRTSDPNHREAGFSTTCQDCHDVFDWRSAGIDHDAFFPLTGAHRPLQCESCHADGFEGTPTDCYSCHVNDYNGTRDPNHSAAGFSTSCDDCHTTSNWDATFDHSSFFALSGAHQRLECESCHADGFEGTPTDCYSCHVGDYEATDDPDHLEAGFPTSCEDCHSTTDWTATFDHDAFFVLTGAHLQASCESCHADGFEGTPTDCYSCHVEEYDATTDPDHRDAGFSTSCQDCHDTSAWEGATFNHDAFFALTGAHRGLECESCHADGFEGTPTDCYSCHVNDYNATTDPNHSAAGFPTTCESCHTTSNWDASFDHDAFFALTGAHRNLNCDSCHADGFEDTPTDCYSCHVDDYDRTTEPNHRAAGFPTSCEECHSTSSWDGATFDHDSLYFPIFSGKHEGEWDTCADCHVVPTNFEVFECIRCHEHRRSETDDEHDEVPGYVYESQACYSCHPDGQD